MGILGHFGNPQENNHEFTRSVVGQLKEALPVGSYLGLYESADTAPANNEAIRTYNESGAAPYRLRSGARAAGAVNRPATHPRRASDCWPR